MRDWFDAYVTMGGIRFIPQTWEGWVAFSGLMLVFGMLELSFMVMNRGG